MNNFAEALEHAQKAYEIYLSRNKDSIQTKEVEELIEKIKQKEDTF